MKIRITDCKINGDEVEAMAKFTGTLKEIEKAGGRYDRDSLQNIIIDSIASIVAKEYLKEKRMELVNGIDINQLINAIQLKVVEGFSLQQR